MTSELSIIIPTYNEKDNILPLISHLQAALDDIQWEVVFVDDDSPDGTAQHVRDLAQNNPKIKCLQRIKRRGLASACIEGILSTSSPFIAVMDADMQHDENALPEMLSILKKKDVDIVIGSRYAEGGGTGDLDTSRVWMSRFATLLSRLVMNKSVTDPMSGFFMIRRPTFEQVMRNLSGRGFKILLDIMVTAGDSLRVVEYPYIMRKRSHGESKLNFTVIWEFLTLIIYRLLGRLIPARFISFATVGFTGIFVHMSVLWFLYMLWVIPFMWAQIIATVTAMTSNYILNNIFTFREYKLKGKYFIKGLISFYIACTIGAVINVAVADLLFNKSVPWWLAGGLGAVAGAVWNYAMISTFTWRERFEQNHHA